MPGYDFSPSPSARVLKLNKANTLTPSPHKESALKGHHKAFLQGGHRGIGAKLESYLAWRSHSRKDYIYFPFENTDKLYVIRRGFVEVGVLSRDGRELSIEILSEGDIFGSILETKMEGEFVRAIGPTVIGDMHRDDVKMVMQKHPDLVISMLKVVEERHQRLSNKLQNLVFQDVKGRICQLLLDLHQKWGNSNGRIPITLTHQDIANLVASSRETASLHLSELKKGGLLDYNRRYIRILSPRDLTRLVG